MLYYIIKPPSSGELCEEITEFVVAEHHLSPTTTTNDVISTYSTSDEGGFNFYIL